MNERKATKRALLTSITALVMCVVMLAGTTFAWFTDTASTNVNKIQAGKLDVQLMMATAWDTDGNPTSWADAEGETLSFLQKQAGGTVTQNANILWEPGCTYELPELKVVNNGNLALKYEIAITGAVDADGDDNLDSMKLLNVLKFKSVVDSDTKENVYGQTIATGTLDANGKEQIIKLSAKMDENAGNDYMNMALSNITVTVKAMQASYEYDSNGNTYDRDANGNPDNPTWSISANVTAPVVSGGNTVISNADKTAVATVPADAVDTSTTELTWNVTASDSAAASVNISSAQAAVGYDVSVAGLKTGNTTPVKVELKVGAGLTNVVLHHKGLAMRAGTSADNLTDGQYFYDASTGILTFATSTFSPFAVVYDAPTAIIGDTYYDTLAGAVAAAKNGDTITLLRDANGDGITVQGGKVFTLDFGGHSYTVDGKPTGSEGTKSQAFQLLTGSTIVFKNGKIIGNIPGVRMLIQNYCNLTLDNMTLDATVGNNSVSYSMSNNCGIVTIKDTTITAKANGVAFDVYGGFGSYDDVTVTVDGNSVINGDIELARDTGSSNTNKNTNTLELKNCTINGNIEQTDGTLWFAGNVTLNGNVNASGIDDEDNRIAVTEKTTLNLNGKIITPDNMGNNKINFTALMVRDDTTINAGVNGGIDTKKNGAYGINVLSGANLVINGGTYYGGGTAVQAQKGFVTINDGNFAVEPYSNPVYGYKFMLNCIDTAYSAGEAGFTVYGGTYTGFDPSNSDSENPRASFVPEGYTCTKTGEDVWTVAKSNPSPTN